MSCPDYVKDGGFNTPRLLSVGGNELILACDWIPPRGRAYSEQRDLAVVNRQG